MRFRSIVLTATLVCVSNLFAEPATTFVGKPSIKISEAGSDRVVEELKASQATKAHCVIGKEGASYYWLSRDKKELIRNVGGAFSTYVALDGSGYVRVINPESKHEASFMSETEKRFDYSEHLLIGLRSVTYYGNFSN